MCVIQHNVVCNSETRVCVCVASSCRTRRRSGRFHFLLSTIPCTDEESKQMYWTCVSLYATVYYILNFDRPFTAHSTFSFFFSVLGSSSSALSGWVVSFFLQHRVHRVQRPPS